jgi:excisionase family DNA binding protein
VTVTKPLLTTGQAAKLCSVTRDTVLRWLRGGRLPGTRTAGGHYRIDPADLEQLLSSVGEPEPLEPCWTYHSKDGRLSDGCAECSVYRARALRCFEMAALPGEAGHRQKFCEQSCAQCDYYEHVQGHAAHVVVLTGDAELTRELDGAETELLKFRVVSTGYDLAREVQDSRLDLVVIDGLNGRAHFLSVATSLLRDPRARLIRVLLAADPAEVPEDLKGRNIEFLSGRPDAERIREHLGRVWREIHLAPCDRI